MAMIDPPDPSEIDGAGLRAFLERAVAPDKLAPDAVIEYRGRRYVVNDEVSMESLRATLRVELELALDYRTLRELIAFEVNRAIVKVVSDE